MARRGRRRPRRQARGQPEARAVEARGAATPTPARRAALVRPLGAALALTLAVAAGYGGSLDHPYVFDDHDAIANNDSIASLSTALAPPKAATVSARPVLNLSLALDRAAGAEGPRGHRLTNLGILLGGALLLFGLVRRSLRRPRFGGRFLEADADALAFAVALLWCVHPYQTGSVTYIIQRAESLAALFCLATLYCLLRSASARGLARVGAWQVGAVVACALGMLTKEVTVALPLIALVYDRIFLASGWGELLRRRGPLHLALFASIGLVFWIISAYDWGRSIKDPTNPGLGWNQYRLSQPRVIFRYYLAGYLWPTRQVFDYHHAVVARGAAQIVPYAVALAGLATASLWALWRRPALGFLSFFFFGYIALTCWYRADQVAAEHRIYLPSAALVTALVLGAYRGWQRLRPAPEGEASGRERLRRFAPPLALLALTTVALVLLTRARNEDYRSAVALWQDTARKVPTAKRAQLNLGYQLAVAGRAEEARAAFGRALALAPGWYRPLLYRGRLHLQARRLDAAVADFSAVIEGRPDLARGYYRRAQALAALGQRQAALADLDAALAREPGLVAASLLRGDLRVDGGQLAGALADYTKVLAAEPDRVGALERRALTYARLRQADKARADVAAIRALGKRPSPRLLQIIAGALRGP